MGLCIVLQLAYHHRHRGEWRTEFVSRARRLCAEGDDALVAQDFFAYLNQLRIPVAHRLCHLDHEIRYHHRADDKTQPHAQHMGVECAVRGYVHIHRHAHVVAHFHVMRVVWQGNVIHHQQAVAGRGECGHAPGVTGGQGRGSDDQRQQIQRNERVGRTAREIQQKAQCQHVEAGLRE